MRLGFREFISISVMVFWLAACTTVTEPALTNQDSQTAAGINVQLGVNYLQQGDLEQADLKLRKALKQDPHSSTAHWVFALLQERLGENETAEKHYRKAISLDKNDSRAHNNYGTFLCNQDRIDEAEKEFLTAIDNPLYAQADSAFVNAGICVLKIPDENKAEKYFQEALTINPRHRGALYQMGRLAFQRKNYEEASYYIQQYEQYGRHNSESLWLAYQSEINLGNKGRADDYAHQLKRSFPSSREARLLAESYWNAGKSN